MKNRHYGLAVVLLAVVAALIVYALISAFGAAVVANAPPTSAVLGAPSPSDFTLAGDLETAGFSLVIVFVILNFGVERVFFPAPHRMTPANQRPVPPLVGGKRRAHIFLGTLQSLCFVAGWVMVVMGFAVLGTRGYGSF